MEPVEKTIESYRRRRFAGLLLACLFFGLYAGSWWRDRPLKIVWFILFAAICVALLLLHNNFKKAVAFKTYFKKAVALKTFEASQKSSRNRP